MARNNPTRKLPASRNVPKIVSQMDGSDRSSRSFKNTKPTGKGSGALYRGPRKGDMPVPRPGKSGSRRGK